MKVRRYRRGDEQSFLLTINTAYRNLENLTIDRVKRLTSSPHFNPDGFYFAEKEGKPVGCVGVFSLPAERYLETRYLAVKEAFSNLDILDALTDSALKYSASKHPKLVKAVTLTIQPYVRAYEQCGFKPVRRILRIAWDTTKALPVEPQSSKATVSELREDDVDEASQVFLEGLQPYWDWWAKEQGGNQAVLKQAADWLTQYAYLVAKVKNKTVGVAGIVWHPERNEASFSGVIVLPKFRMKGIGSALMNAALNKARQLGYKRLVVHTVAYLDSLAPRAVLYLKSGGRIEAEYIHLVKSLESRTKSRTARLPQVLNHAV